MDLTTILPIIVSAIVAILGAVGGVILARNKAAEAALATFNALCDSQQNRLKEVEKELRELRQELAVLRAENEVLRERIRLLEEEREALITELSGLKRQRQAGA